MGFGKKLARAAVFGAMVAGFGAGAQAADLGDTNEPIKLALNEWTGLGAGAQAADLGDTNEPIKLALNEWTGQHITTKVAGTILQRMGYDVEYVTAGYYPQLTAIRDNTISATLEIWSSNIGEHYMEALASGQAVELGDLGLVPVETWFYNQAAGDACPGLPNWEALNDCAEAFANVDTFPDGRLLDYPADWGTTNVDRLSALSLPLQSVPAGSEGALVAEIKAAETKSQPILVQFWSPHWLHAEVALTIVALPPYEDGCNEDPAVGLNPDVTYDCDWARGHINKIGWIGMKDKWPAAFRLGRLETVGRRGHAVTDSAGARFHGRISPPDFSVGSLAA
jgi:glycine betaine/proline transport system substrate-binding protein